MKEWLGKRKHCAHKNNPDMQESIAVVCNIEDLVDGALQGFPVTVFAFGQTGSVRFAQCAPLHNIHSDNLFAAQHAVQH